MLPSVGTMSEYRCDAGTLRKAELRTDGSMVVEAHITRAGVLKYRNPDGTERSEYRPPEEVFKLDSMESFALVPVTDEHPPKMLTTRTVKKYAAGTTGENIRQDGDHVAARLVITDDALIAKMKAGKREVSCGYACDIDNTPGVTPDGVRYDAVQRNIRGNHLAVTTHGRVGSARVRMDSVLAEITEDDTMADTRTDAFPPAAKKKGPPVAPAAAPAAAPAPVDPAAPPADPVAAEDPAAEAETTGEAPAADPAAPVAGGSIEARLASALGEIAKLIQELTDAKAGAAAATARADAAEASFEDRVRGRVELLTVAGPVLGAEVRLDSLTDREVQLAVVKHVTGVDVSAEKSDDYVAARYDAALERYEAAGMANAKLAEVLNLRRDHAAPGNKPTEQEAADARAEMIARNRGTK